MPLRLSAANAPTRSSSRAPVPPRISDRLGVLPGGKRSWMPECDRRAAKRAGPTRCSRSTEGTLSDSRNALEAPIGPLKAMSKLPGR
jgi:hypothetical protein